MQGAEAHVELLDPVRAQPCSVSAAGALECQQQAVLRVQTAALGSATLGMSAWHSAEGRPHAGPCSQGHPSCSGTWLACMTPNCQVMHSTAWHIDHLTFTQQLQSIRIWG